MKERGENKITRRSMMKLSGAAGVSAFARISTSEASPSLGDFFSEIEAASDDLLQNSSIIAHGSHDDALRVIAANKVEVPWQILKGTKLDPLKLEDKTVMLALVKGEMGIKISRMKTLEDMRIIEAANQGRAIYAQGVPVASNLVLTNKHVSSAFKKRAGDVMVPREHPYYDLAFALLPDAGFSLHEMVRYPIPLANEDVHAGFVVFTGINPNRTAHDTGASVVGKKTFGGMAVRVPEGFMRSLCDNREPTAAELKRFRNSFIVEIPNAESLGENDEVIPIQHATFRGSSSSPVFVLRGDTYHFCGIVDSVLQTRLPNGKIKTFALFHGPEAINQAAKELGQY